MKVMIYTVLYKTKNTVDVTYKLKKPITK